MAFGNAALPTRKYAYGALEFIPRQPGSGEVKERFEGFNAVLAQFRLAKDYHYALLENEVRRRREAEEVVRTSAPQMESLLALAEQASQQTEELRSQLAASNSAARRRQRNSELAKRIREQKKISDAAWATYKAYRKAAYAEAKPALSAVEHRAAEEAKAIRNRFIERGLYWGTAAIVPARIDRKGAPPDPKKAYHSNSDTIAVQFQRKGKKGSAKVPVLDANGNPKLSPNGRKPMTRAVEGGSLSVANLRRPNTLCWVEQRCDKKPERVWVHFRVASDERGNPVWAKVPAVFHRPLPADAEVKWAYLHQTKVGYHYKWQVIFDVAKPQWEYPHRRAESGVVAVSLGWRRIDGGLRVATWVGDDGESGEVTIDPHRVSTWKGCDDLQSHRDDNFNQCRDLLVDFLKSQQLPEEWKNRTETLAHWRSPERFFRLVGWWRHNRLVGDDFVFRQCEGELANHHYTGGRKQDRHLKDWAQFRKRKCRGWRKIHYRRSAMELAERYGTVVVSEINWHTIAANPSTEKDDERVTKTYKGMASCAKLREELKNCFNRFVCVAPSGTASHCFRCGTDCGPLGAGRWLVCEHCGGERVDRAVNVCRNLLQQGPFATECVTSG